MSSKFTTVAPEVKTEIYMHSSVVTTKWSWNPVPDTISSTRKSTSKNTTQFKYVKAFELHCILLMPGVDPGF